VKGYDAALTGRDDADYDHEYPNGDGPTGPLERHDLAEAVRRPAVQPVTLEGLVYPGKLHSLAGPPGAGKTVLCLWWAWKVMLLGHPVLIMDEEAGADQTADVLRSFGADPALLEKHLHYVPFSQLDWRRDTAITKLHEFLARQRPVLAIFDSSAAMMALSGCKEIDPGDVTRFWKRVWLPVAQQYGCAVAVTDHVSAGGRGADRQGARGTDAKVAEVDVQFKLSATHSFSHHEDGLLNLEITKDRPGWLHRNWQIAVTRDPLTLDLRRTSPPAQAEGGSRGMSPATRKLLDVMNDIPASGKDLVDRVVHKYGHGLQRQTVSTSLQELLDAGQVDRLSQGEGRQALWVLPGGELPVAQDPDGWPEGSTGASAQERP
jgi:hypothetical protein